MQLNEPVNCGATVPRVNFENLRDDKIIGLYCSRIGSTELRISSDAACTTMCQKMQIEVTKKTQKNKREKKMIFPSP